MQAYRALEDRFARLSSIADVIGLLHWDARTMMPDGAAEDRANQLAILNGLAHGLLTAPKIRDRLDEAEQSGDALSPWQRANLREMRRAYRHAAALPSDLVEASARAVAPSTAFRAPGRSTITVVTAPTRSTRTPIPPACRPCPHPTILVDLAVSVAGSRLLPRFMTTESARSARREGRQVCHQRPVWEGDRREVGTREGAIDES